MARRFKEKAKLLSDLKKHSRLLFFEGTASEPNIKMLVITSTWDKLEYLDNKGNDTDSKEGV